MGNMEKFYEYLKGIVVNFRVKSCCCVAPLRVGILFLAYFNVTVAILDVKVCVKYCANRSKKMFMVLTLALTQLVLIVGTASSSFVPMAVRVQEIITDGDASVFTCILAPIFDFAFSVVLVCAMQRRDLVLLRVYCWYGLAAICGSLLVYSLVIPVIEALYLFVIIISLTYQAYVLILVRSVMVEIRLANAAAKNQLYYDKNTERIIIRDVEKPIETYAIVPHPEDKDKVEIQVVNEMNQVDDHKESVSKSNTLKINTIAMKTEPTVWKTSHYAIVHKPTLVTAVDTIVTPSIASTSKDTLKHETSKDKEIEEKKVNTDTKEDSTKDKVKDVNSITDTTKGKKEKDAKRDGKDKIKDKKDPKPSGKDTIEGKKEKDAKLSGKKDTNKDTKETDVEDKDKTEIVDEKIVSDDKKEDVPQKKKRGIFSRKTPKEAKKNDS